MRIYLAGERLGSGRTWLKYVERRLFSFYYHGFSGSNYQLGPSGFTHQIEESMELKHDMFLDSGAFTAFTKQLEIPLDEYAAYIRKTDGMFTCVSNLDDTSKCEQKSWDNQMYLETMGCTVQPVFHAREDTSWLTRYLDRGYDYIFIGGLVPESTGWLLQWLDQLWTTHLTNADGTPRVKVHGFGLTDQKLMFRYPWHSIDSTSWLMTGIFGACLFYVNKKMVKVVFSNESPEARKFKGWHYNNLDPQTQRVVDSWLEPYEVTAQQLSEHYTYRDIINAATFQKLEDLGTPTFHQQQRTLFV